MTAATALESPSGRCESCAVRDVALCAALDDAELAALNALGRRRRVARGEAIVWAGDENLICANIVAGIIKLTMSTADGREQIVGLLYPGDFLGELFADEAGLTATAITPTDLCIYPRGGFRAVLARHPALQHSLLRRTSASLDQARRRMLTLARASAGQRVAGFLHDLAARAGGTHAPLRFDLPLSRGEIAELLGLTIETVSRQFTALQTRGIVRLSGRRAAILEDPEALAALAA